MTPPSIHRIQSDDELLDLFGGRLEQDHSKLGGDDDELSTLLSEWVAHVDDIDAGVTEKASGRHARIRRTGFRAGAAAGVLVGALSVSGMAAAMTSTEVPGLRQLGKVTRALIFDAPAVATQHQEPKAGASVDPGSPAKVLATPPPTQSRSTPNSTVLPLTTPSSAFRIPAGRRSALPPAGRTTTSSEPRTTARPTAARTPVPSRTTPPKSTPPVSTASPTTPPTSPTSPTPQPTPAPPTSSTTPPSFTTPPTSSTAPPTSSTAPPTSPQGVPRSTKAPTSGDSSKVATPSSSPESGSRSGDAKTP